MANLVTPASVEGDQRAGVTMPGSAFVVASNGLVLSVGCGRVSGGVSGAPWVSRESQGQVHLGQTGTLALRMSGFSQLRVSSSISYRQCSSFLRQVPSP